MIPRLVIPPLLTEKDRPALNRAIDQLEMQLIGAILEMVPQGATPLFKRGYRPHELEILGFGSEITVEPLKKLWRIHLWWRRALLAFHFATLPTFRQYGEIPCRERDTQRLIDELKIFSVAPRHSVLRTLWHE
jgi:hypothetical protein